MTWADYTAATRRLTAQQNDDMQWRTETANELAAWCEDLNELFDRLAVQRGRLRLLAGMSIPPPQVEPDGRTDYRTPAQHAYAAADRADAAIERAKQATLLPLVPRLMRSTIVYTATVVLWVCSSFALFAVGGLTEGSPLPFPLCWLFITLIAAVSFAKLVLTLFGRTMREEYDEREQRWHVYFH